MRPLHVLNYGWPFIDGYTVRAAGLISAQRDALGWSPLVAVSPFAPLAKSRDEGFRTSTWGPDQQRNAVGRPERGWERSAVGFAPVSTSAFRAALTRLILEMRPDLVHAHHPHPVGRAARAAARRAGLPFVYEIRCFNGDYDLDHRSAYKRARGRWINALELQLARQADAVVTIADGLASRLSAGGVAERRIHVVRNSVDDQRFAPGKPRSADGKIRIGYATTFERMENLDGLVLGVAQLLERRPALRERLQVILAGEGRDLARIGTLVAERGLGDVIELPGFLPYSRIPAFLATLNLFVVPRGAFAVSAATTPLKPLEALAAGLPILASDLPALRELMGGRPDVRFVAPTPEGLADALERFIDTPWPGGDGIGERSWRAEVTKYRGIYDAARSGVLATARPAERAA